MAQRWPFTLRLGPDAADLSVAVEFEHVATSTVVQSPARMRLERFEPRWFAATAGLAIGGLVLLSVAAGSVSVAPPPPPTPLPGQPTPTTGPPSLRVGNLVIQAPVAARPTASPTEAVVVAEAAVVPTEAAPMVASATPPVEAEAAAPEPDSGGGFFRLPRLPFLQAPPRPTAVPKPVAQPTAVADAPVVAAPEDAQPAVLPVASPAARISGPRRGSALDDALRTASIANDEFNRGLHEPVPNGSQP
jgi:hypothetical protein